MTMQKRKILILSATFYPANSPRSFRTTELAKEFARQGHEVVVYIPHNGFDYSAFLQEHPIQLKHLGKLSYKPIKLKGKKMEMLLRRGVKRALGLLFEFPSIELMFKVSRHLKEESGYDMLISIAVPYPIHWGIARIRSGRNRIAKTWVADCGDPYMGEATDSFRKLFYFKYVEKWFFRKTDFISVPFEGARSAYYPEFQEKIRIIPQGFRLDELAIPEYKKKEGCPVFAYAGSFIPGRRDPGPLLDCLLKNKAEFRFIVYTSQSGMLVPFKKKLGEKLIIRDYVSRDDLLLVLAGMDFLINFDNNTHTQLPSKLIDYAITGRPIFNISSDTDLSIIMEFLKGDYSRKMDLPPSSDYDIRTVVKKFAQLQNSN